MLLALFLIPSGLFTVLMLCLLAAFPRTSAEQAIDDEEQRAALISRLDTAPRA